MINIESIRNKYRNKQIWVLGTGLSLNDFPLDFFCDKITIGVNGVIYKYEPTLYFAIHHIWWDYIIKNKPKYIIKNTILEKRVDNYGNYFSGMNLIPYFINTSHYTLEKRPFEKKDIENLIDDIEDRKKNITFLESGTVIHIAIEIAFLLGSNNIVLAGCEHKKYLNNMSNFDIGIKYPRVGDKTKDPWEKPDYRIEKMTRWLAEEIESRGYFLRRYYNKNTRFYKKGYEKINE